MLVSQKIYTDYVSNIDLSGFARKPDSIKIPLHTNKCKQDGIEVLSIVYTYVKQEKEVFSKKQLCKHS